MLDIKVIREREQDVRHAIKQRGMGTSLDELLALDQRRRDRLGEVERLKAERNAASKEIGQKEERAGCLSRATGCPGDGRPDSSAGCGGTQRAG